jgi:myosin heavy subunit
MQALEAQASTDAMHDRASMMEKTEQLEKENTDLKCRVSSLEADNANISSSERRRQELERTNADLLMRIQAFEAQANTEQDANTKMREFATQLESENAELKCSVSTLEAHKASISSSERRRQELERTNADLMMRIQALEAQASTGQDASDAMQRKATGFEQDAQEARKKAEQAHALQELLLLKNRELQEQVRISYLREAGRSYTSDQTMRDKKQLHPESQGMSARDSGASPSVNLARAIRTSTSHVSLSSPEVDLKLSTSLAGMGSTGSGSSPLESDLSPLSKGTRANIGRGSNAVSPLQLSSPTLSPRSARTAIGQTPLGDNSSLFSKIGPQSLVNNESWSLRVRGGLSA